MCLVLVSRVDVDTSMWLMSVHAAEDASPKTTSVHQCLVLPLLAEQVKDTTLREDLVVEDVLVPHTLIVLEPNVKRFVAEEIKCTL